MEAKGLILPSNLKVLDVTSPEYGGVICDPSDSDSDVSDESSEVDELFESDSDEIGDWEEEGSVDDDLSHSDSVESRDYEGSEVD